MTNRRRQTARLYHYRQLSVFSVCPSLCSPPFTSLSVFVPLFAPLPSHRHLCLSLSLFPSLHIVICVCPSPCSPPFTSLSLFVPLFAPLPSHRYLCLPLSLLSLLSFFLSLPPAVIASRPLHPFPYLSLPAYINISAHIFCVLHINCVSL